MPPPYKAAWPDVAGARRFDCRKTLSSGDLRCCCGRGGVVVADGHWLPMVSLSGICLLVRAGKLPDAEVSSAMYFSCCYSMKEKDLPWSCSSSFIVNLSLSSNVQWCLPHCMMDIDADYCRQAGDESNMGTRRYITARPSMHAIASLARSYILLFVIVQMAPQLRQHRCRSFSQQRAVCRNLERQALPRPRGDCARSQDGMREIKRASCREPCSARWRQRQILTTRATASPRPCRMKRPM